MPSKCLRNNPQLRSLAERRYTERRDEGIVIGAWPVQFLPVASELDAEALDHALDEVIRVGQEDEVRTRILRPEHLVAIAFKIGRPKNYFRIAQFLETGAVHTASLCAVLDRHGLRQLWQKCCDRAGISDRGLDSPRMTDKHPDISDILKRKAEGRHSRAARSFAEKVASVARAPCTHEAKANAISAQAKSA